MKTFKIPTKQRYLSAQEYLKDINRNQHCNNIEQVQFSSFHHKSESQVLVSS